MANPIKGDVAFGAGDAQYILRFSVDALCALEDAAGKPIIALAADLSDASKISMGLLRKVVWAGLREHHPDIDLKAAGELIVGAGGLNKMMVVVSHAFELAFPAEDNVSAPASGGGVRSHPQKPGRSGTGSAS